MLASLHIYPVKGCRAVDLDQAAVEPWGLAGDRRWLIVDPDCQFMTQRKHPALARVVIACGPGADIEVSTGGFPSLRVAAPDESAELLKVTVWRSTVLAAAAGPEADAWFSAYLGESVRLVYLDDPTRRAVDPEYGADGDMVSFADGYPLLLTSAGSLDQLGQWLTEAGDQPVPAERGRVGVRAVGRGPVAAGADRRGLVPRRQALRPVRGHHHRPGHRRARRPAAENAGGPPPVRPEPGIRAESHPRLPRPYPNRRPNRNHFISL
jgi:uncharacterized protein